jgi:hypothetical protein
MATFQERLINFIMGREPEGTAGPAGPGEGTAARAAGPYPSLPRGHFGARARLTTDPSSSSSSAGGFGSIATPDQGKLWRDLNLNSKTLDRMGTPEILLMLADISPEVSSALWNFVRFSNPGWELKAFKPGTAELDEKGNQALEDFQATLSENYGAVDSLWNSLFITAYLRGAFCAELVLDKNGRYPIDFIILDPDGDKIEFELVDDPERGVFWQIGQKQDQKFIPLNYPTIRYVPVDPPPNKPYGRAPAEPALFSSLFLLGLLHDLKRVVSQQGYPRIDITVKLAELDAIMPESIKGDSDQVEKWVDAVVQGIASSYDQLQPDDAFVHTDVTEIGDPVGTIDSSSLGAVDGLLRGLERMITRGLKTMPLLMGSNESVSETHANRQWEIHAASIKALQHLAEEMISRLFTVMLQAQGIQATAVIRFAELRASEQLRDAQTEEVIIRNAMAKYLAGWTSHEEASLEVTGSDPDAAAPRVMATAGTAGSVGSGTVANDDEIEDGESRSGAGAAAQVATELRLARIAVLESLMKLSD